MEAQRQFDNLMVDDGTAILLPALLFGGVGHGHRRVRIGRSRRSIRSTLCDRSADWLLTKEVRRKGDWSVKRPKTEPSGWYFEFANEFYPDIDDTAMVLLALQPFARFATPRRRQQHASIAPFNGCSTCSPKTAVGRRSTWITTGVR